MTATDVPDTTTTDVPDTTTTAAPTDTGHPADHPTDPADHPSAPTADDVAERLFEASLGAFETLAVAVGDRLGWYRALRDDPATPQQLAARTDTSARYAREWLEQQAAIGLLERTGEGGDARYAMSAPVAEVMTDESSLAYLAPLARMVSAAGARFDHLLDAYRRDGGVGWDDFGPAMRTAQADMNRPWFEHELPGAVRGIDDLDAILRREGARIADVGFGGGWSSIALARTYPSATVEGYDVDLPSVELATRNADDAGLADRVTFHQRDAATIDEVGPFDAIFAFECLHDMPHPVEALSAMRRGVRDDGAVVIMDEAVGDDLDLDGDPVEQLMYGFSVFVCLPDGKAHPRSAETGTVFRPRILRDYARRAGFDEVEILPIEDFGFWRFYRLR